MDFIEDFRGFEQFHGCGSDSSFVGWVEIEMEEDVTERFVKVCQKLDELRFAGMIDQASPNVLVNRKFGKMF